MVETSIRHRVLLEPRGFIRVIEFVLAIIAFATTGGYHSESIGTLKCGENPKSKKFTVPISYPFNLEADKINVPTCNSNNTGYGPDAQVQLTGDFSPTSQWFVFVGVMAFLICLATIVFYVAFETSIRATNESAVTVTDLVVTVIWAFLWLTAASAWAWGVNQVKTYGDANAAIKLEPLKTDCARPGGNVCFQIQGFDAGPLNASVAFAFLSFIVWAGNVWFVYKETPYHDDQANLTPNEGMPSQEVPTAQ